MRTKPVDILRHPILQEATNVCHAIEKCGASDLLTEAVIKASALVNSIDDLLNGLDTKGGWVGAEVSVDLRKLIAPLIEYFQVLSLTPRTKEEQFNKTADLELIKVKVKEVMPELQKQISG